MEELSSDALERPTTPSQRTSTLTTVDHTLAVEIPWDYVSTNIGRVDPLITHQPRLQENMV